jgi:hypothetical protein
MPRSATKMKVNGVKGHAVSDDGANVIVSFSTRYVGDFELTMPKECVDQLISSLNEARGAGPATSSKSAPMSDTVAVLSDLADMDASSVKVRVPKKWLVAADHTVRFGVVLLVFDHKADTQIGFALDPISAKKISAGLNKEADAVSARRKGRSS